MWFSTCSGVSRKMPVSWMAPSLKKCPGADGSVAFVEALAYAERSPAFREQMRDHYRRIQDTVARLVEAALGPDAAAKGADPMVIALFLIAVFDGLAVQFRMAPEETPSGEQLVDALTAALASMLGQNPDMRGDASGAGGAAASSAGA